MTTIIFDANGGTNQGTGSVQVGAGQITITRAPWKYGNRIAYYDDNYVLFPDQVTLNNEGYLKPNVTIQGVQYTDSAGNWVPTTSTMTLKPHWESASLVNLSLVGNGATVTAKSYFTTSSSGQPTYQTITQTYGGQRVDLTCSSVPSGYSFVRWESNQAILHNSTSESNAWFIMPDSTTTVTAVLQQDAPTEYNITVYSETGILTYGAYILSGGRYSEVTKASAGTTIYLRCSINSTDYTFGGWSSSDVTLNNSSSQTGCYFTMPSKAVTARCYANKITYSITKNISPSGSGSITLSKSSGLVSGDYVTISASPSTGYSFTGWSTTGGTLVDSTSPSTYLIMPAGNVTLTATFQQVAIPKLTLACGTSGLQPITSPLIGTPTGYAPDSAVTITSNTPSTTSVLVYNNIAYVFDYWSGSPITQSIKNNNPCTFLMPNSDTTVTAYYKRAVCTVVFSTPYGTTPASQTVTSGDLVTKPADPEHEGFVFDGWYKESTFNTPWNFSTDTPQQLTTTLYGKWSAVSLYTLTVNQPEHGTISQSPEGTQFEIGTNISFTATSDSGYVFDSWAHTGSGAFTTSNNTAVLTMAGNETVTCTFASGTTYEIETMNYRGGMISPTSGTVSSGNYITFTSYPSPGYTFDKLEIIEGEGTINGYRVTPYSNCKVRAVFSKLQEIAPQTPKSGTDRFSILVHNENGFTLFTMKPRSNQWYGNLIFKKSLESISSGSFDCNMYNGSLANPVNGVVIPNAYVTILECGKPIYTGYITEVTQQENNYYTSHTNTERCIYNVSFDDVARALNYSKPELPETVRGNPAYIFAHIVDHENLGDIYSESALSYSFNISASNRLSLIDGLRDQCGWRYRTKPYIVNEINSGITSFPHTSASGNVVLNSTVRNLKLGDIIIIVNKGNIHIFKCNTSSSSASTIPVIGGMHTGLVELDTSNCTLYTLRNYTVDFKPSYYQSTSVVKANSRIPVSVGSNNAWVTNETARNVNESITNETNYGSVSVTSNTPYGTVATATIPLITRHDKDYTINKSTFITKSWDAEILEYGYEEVTSTQTYLYLRLAGEFGNPDDITEIEENILYKATCFNIWYSGPSGKKRIFRLIQGGGDVTDGTIDSVDSITDMGDGTTRVRFVMTTNQYNTSFITQLKDNKLQLNTVRTNTYFVADSSVLGQTNTTVSILLGSEPCTARITLNGAVEVVRPDIIDGDDADAEYAHMEGAIVVKGTVSNPDNDSPYKKHPNMILSVTTQSNYPYMYADYLASVYAVYGSNFDNESDCQIPLPFFANKIDYTPKVGDHVSVYNSRYTTSEGITDGELLSYEIDINSFTCSVTYGTSWTGLPEILYILRKNTSMNITRK